MNNEQQTNIFKEGEAYLAKRDIANAKLKFTELSKNRDESIFYVQSVYYLVLIFEETLQFEKATLVENEKCEVLHEMIKDLLKSEKKANWLKQIKEKYPLLLMSLYFKLAFWDSSPQDVIENIQLGKDIFTQSQQYKDKNIEDIREEYLALNQKAQSENLTLIQWSMVLSYFNRFSHAYHQINNIVEKNPNNFTAIYYKAMIYYNQGQFEASYVYFKKSIELVPEFYDHYCYAYKCKKEQLKIIQNDPIKSEQIQKEAEEVFNMGMEFNKNNPHFLYSTAILLEYWDEVERGYPMLEECIRLDPDNQEAYIALCDYKHSLATDLKKGIINEEKQDEAFEDFKGFIDRFQPKPLPEECDDEQIKNEYQKQLKKYTENLLEIGNLLQDKKIFDQAIIYFEKAIEIDPKTPANYKFLAELFQEDQDYDNAALNFKKALVLTENKSTLYLNLLGECLISLEQFEQSENLFLRSKQIDPENAETYYGLAEVYLNMDDQQKFKVCVQKCIQLDPYHISAHDLLIEHLSEQIADLSEHSKKRKAIIEEICQLLHKVLSQEISARFLVKLTQCYLKTKKKMEEIVKYYERCLENDEKAEQEIENEIEEEKKTFEEQMQVMLEEIGEENPDEEEQQFIEDFKKNCEKIKKVNKKLIETAKNRLKIKQTKVFKNLSLKNQFFVLQSSNLWKKAFRKDINFEIAQFL